MTIQYMYLKNNNCPNTKKILMRSVEFTYFLYFSLVIDERIFVLQVLSLSPFVLFVAENIEHLSPFHL